MTFRKIPHLSTFGRTLSLALVAAAVVLGLATGAHAQTALAMLFAPGATFAGLVSDSAGNLYGTSYGGGSSQSCTSGIGCGTVFELSPPTSGGSWTETVLYTFSGGSDGSSPEAGLVFDSKGNLYGTASAGGNLTACNQGCGVVFELSPTSTGGWKETVLHAFSVTDGSTPVAGLVFDSKGNLYGTASFGGASGDGTAFKLSHTGASGWKAIVIHNFRGADGTNPQFPLIADSAGNLYGTTTKGGTYSSGVAFRLSQPSGVWKEAVIHDFTGTTDGQFPAGGLTFDSAGNLYGTTQWGGTGQCGGLRCGVVFRLSPSGNRWKQSVLYNFTNSEGGYLTAGVTFDGAGNLYGTTDGWPTGCTSVNGCGQVFQLTRTRSGWTLGAVYATPINSSPSYGGLIRDASGNLFGTVTDAQYLTYGNVFELTP